MRNYKPYDRVRAVLDTSAANAGEEGMVSPKYGIDTERKGCLVVSWDSSYAHLPDAERVEGHWTPLRAIELVVAPVTDEEMAEVYKSLGVTP